MRWKKLGLVYGPDGSQPWAQSHAMLPTPIRLNASVIRVFITCWDAKGIGRPCFVDISANDPRQVLRISQRPLLDLGQPGTFDENGVLVCSVSDMGDGHMYMYYSGYELGTKIPYRLLSGLAVSDDAGETFSRCKLAPILERTDKELCFRCAPYCRHEGGRFKLWYVAGSQWTEVGGKSVPVYDVRYAESIDGMHWPDEGEVKIAVTDPDEHGLGRPCVIAHPRGGFRMFYSVRRRSLEAYRLGYAESMDGRTWNRMDDQLNLDVTPGSFDSDAIMYAAPLTVDGKLYLFYNGNNFGRDGFAVAVLEAE